MYRACLFLICALPLAAAAVEETETITRSFIALPGSEVVVENVMGSIRVTATGGNEVRAVVRKRLEADNEEQAAEARRDVRLEAVHEGSRVRFWVHYPKDGESRRRREYRVSFDFELEVPADARLRLKTVLGQVTAKGAAAFDVETVNGGVELTDLAGAGTAKTVNGKVRASFARNPQEPCSFKTVNGEVEVEFQPGLSAELHAKTLNGAVHTEHPVMLPGGEVAGRRGRPVVARAGAGGPEHRFESVNGDIQIRNRGI
jgi:DUF4097 and DUF4098 domain-containing protein YvlB